MLHSGCSVLHGVNSNLKIKNITLRSGASQVLWNVLIILCLLMSSLMEKEGLSSGNAGMLKKLSSVMEIWYNDQEKLKAAGSHKL